MSEQKENLERHGADQGKQPLFNIVVCILHRKIFFKEAPNNPLRYQVNTPGIKISVSTTCGLPLRTDRHTVS